MYVLCMFFRLSFFFSLVIRWLNIDVIWLWAVLAKIPIYCMYVACAFLLDLGHVNSSRHFDLLT